MWLESCHDGPRKSSGLDEGANECAPKRTELRVVGGFMRSTMEGCNSDRADPDQGFATRSGRRSRRESRWEGGKERRGVYLIEVVNRVIEVTRFQPCVKSEQRARVTDARTRCVPLGCRKGTNSSYTEDLSPDRDEGSGGRV